jgi:hypothetical protein
LENSFRVEYNLENEFPTVPTGPTTIFSSFLKRIFSTKTRGRAQRISGCLSRKKWYLIVNVWWYTLGD